MQSYLKQNFPNPFYIASRLNIMNCEQKYYRQNMAIYGLFRKNIFASTFLYCYVEIKVLILKPATR